MKKTKFTSIEFIDSKVTSTINISMVLYLLGGVILLLLFTNNLSTHIRESLSFDIVLKNHTDKKQIASLQEKLRHMPFTKSLDYISKDQAINQLSEELEQDSQEFLGFNPLPNLIVIYLNRQYSNPDSLVKIKNSLQKFSNNIKETEYHEMELRTISDSLTKMNFIFLMIALILLIISLSLINNMIRIAVYSKRFFIRTMQLIGAKRRFIYGSFILSNIFIGSIAASIACIGLYGLIQYIITTLPCIKTLLDLTSQWIVYGSVLAFGLLITPIASCFSVSKYIDMDINKLYR